jgi:hypothetical protein
VDFRTSVDILAPPETVWEVMSVFARHSIEPVAGGARVRLELRYEGMLGRLLGRLTSGITNRYLGYEAAGLKKRSESLARGEPWPTSA